MVRTPTEIIEATRAAVGTLPEYLTTTKATRAAMRELFGMWDALALCDGFSGAAMLADLDAVAKNIKAIQRAVLSADDRNLSACLRRLTEQGGSLPALAFEIAFDHAETTDEEREALRRLYMHTSQARHADETIIGKLADRLDPPNSDEIIREIVGAGLFNHVAGYDVDIDTVCDYLQERPDVPRSQRLEDFKVWLTGCYSELPRHVLTNAEVFRIAKHAIETTFTRRAAARQFVEVMTKNCGITHAPNGERYTQKSVMPALEQIKAQPAAKLK